MPPPQGKSQLPAPRPFLKWAGGKRQLLRTIAENLPDGWRDMEYHEPFLGGGALLFDLMPSRAVVNDMNSELMNAYEALRSGADRVIGRLSELEGDLSAERYYEMRGMDRLPDFKSLPSHERAARLIYLNRTCFNGLYRVNSRGFFNVPLGRYANPRILDEAGLLAAARYLNTADVKLLCGDFADAVGLAGGGSLVYLDPPYHGSSGNFTSYQSGGFGEPEQERLREVFGELTRRGARCLLSNADTPFIRRLYRGRGFRIVPVQASRAINSRGEGRGKVGEVLVRNY
ncbi:MAG: DNA adenine methylase [Deltaproteobacteria bacterium]|jgi:DNA adenine methylase|nr:DNA adenine methylase [Deltaproteobacteria bacterium]